MINFQQALRKPLQKKQRLQLSIKKNRIGFFVKETLRDDFRMAVETNGDTMTDVLAEYMDYYVKQTRRNNHKFDEKMKKLTSQLAKQMEDGKRLDNEIKKNLRGIGYEL